MSFRVLAIGGLVATATVLVAPGRARAQLAPACAAAPANLGTVTVTAPPPGAVLTSVPGLHYVTGNALDVSLEVDACASVTGVFWRGLEIPLAAAGAIDPAPQSWSVLSTEPIGGGRGRVTIRLQFTNGRRGDSAPVRIRVGSIWGTPAFHDLTVVGVKQVNTQAEYMLSESEMRNQFLTSLARRFGRGGRAGDLRSPDYEGVEFDLRPDGIHFAFSVIRDLPIGDCDPTAHASGTFRLGTAAPSGFEHDILEDLVTLDWVSGPSIDLDWPNLQCGAIDLVEIAPLIGDLVVWIEGLILEDALGDIQDDIEAPFDALHEQPIHAIEHREDALLIRLKRLPLPDSFVVEVPYGSYALDPTTFGVVVEGAVLAVPSGIVSAYRQDYYPWYGMVAFGAGGLPNPRTNVAGLDGGLWPYGGWGMGWDHYYYALDQAERAPAGLPLPDDNVGALVARVEGDPQALLLGAPCSLSGGRRRVALGTNDVANAGIGTFDVTFLVGIAQGPCGHGTPHVGGGIRTHWMRHGGDLGFLGKPLTVEIPTNDGRGWFTDFEGGTIVFTWTTGAAEVHGLIRDRWWQLGGNGAAVGYPTSDELVGADGVGRFNRFEHGGIYWHPSTGDAFEVRFGIHARWQELGAETSWLGYPTSNETGIGRGSFNTFVGGAMYWSPEYGMIAMGSGIRDAYLALGGPIGTLGFPTQDQQQWSGTSWVMFEHGWIAIVEGVVQSGTF